MSRSICVLEAFLRVGLGLLTMTYFSQELTAQQGFTWEQVRDKFESSNPTLRAGEINVAESRAQEITAFLSPNPEVAATLDQVGNTVSGSIFSASNMVTSFSYLHERQGKRELRRDSAQKGTAITESSKEDQKRTLLFNLRNAFVQTLQAKAVLALARENLAYYDRVLSVNRDRFQAGDISQIDLSRLELQRVQYESDIEAATGRSANSEDSTAGTVE